MNRVQRLRGAWGAKGLRGQLVRAGAGSVGIKLTSTALAILLSVILARALGVQEYGVYAFVYALINVISIPAFMGLPTLVVRETAKAKSQNNWGLMRGLWRWSTLVAMLFGLSIAWIASLVLAILGENIGDSRSDTLTFGLIIVPLIALARVRDAALRGLGRVLIGQVSESIVRPALFMLLLAVMVVFASDKIQAANAMTLHAGAAAAAFVVGASLVRKYRPAEFNAELVTSYKSSAWIKSATPLALIAGLNVINNYADILLLGMLRSNSEVGIYRVAMQGSLLVAFGLQAVNSVVQPQFARLHSQKEQEKLQKLVTQSARATLALALPVVILYVFYGRELLLLVFGAEYSAGYTVLVILATGQLINATAGSVGGLLNMTGNERDTLNGMFIAALANIVLNVLLIPQYGAAGAAIATATSLAIWNTILWAVARWRLNIKSTAIGL